MRGMRRVRYAAEYGALSVLCYIARLLPLSWATAASVGIWRIIGPRHRRHQRTLDNMARALPHTTRHDRERIAREMWANMGRTTAEALFLDRIAAQPDRFEVVGLDSFAMQMRQPGPHIGGTLHMGNWELAVWPCAVSGGNSAGVTAPSKTLMSIGFCAGSGSSFTRAACSEKASAAIKTTPGSLRHAEWSTMSEAAVGWPSSATKWIAAGCRSPFSTIKHGLPMFRR